jgi:3-deoxy-D-manno-octulosonic-acid transferase
MLVMALYSLLLVGVLVVGSPYWLARMFFSAKARGRYRAGLGQRLGRVPAELRAAVAGRQVVWVHAVSVGEVLAGTRLVAELEAGLGSGWSGNWVIVVSTTTATGQALARERFCGVNSGRVFYYPLDFAWAVRAYLKVLKPRLLVLMESELWPRMLVECGRRGIPVAVVNARVSDRSFARGVRVRRVWGWVLRRVDLFLAQSEEDARRLVAMGARAGAVRAIGNLKYDVRAPGENAMKKRVGSLLGEARLVVAGSLLEGEERALLEAWSVMQADGPDAVLLLVPRHPQRFNDVVEMVRRKDFVVLRCSTLDTAMGRISAGTVLVLDTLGDLAAVYGLADVAFVGGSLVAKGGHNPLEPAQFGVPVVMGPSFENFRDVVGKMQAADGIRIVQDNDGLEKALAELLTDREGARALGERGRRVFEEQQGATARAVEALVGMVKR